MKEGIPVAKSVATLTGSWYELRLAPGTAHPASLTRLPIKPWSWPDSSTYPNPAPGQIIALSPTAAPKPVCRKSKSQPRSA